MPFEDQAAIAEISTLVTAYARGFAGDPADTVRHYAFPMIYIGADAVTVLGTREQAVGFVEGVQTNLHASGFDHTTVESCDVRMLKSTVALCSVTGTRRRVDGSEIEPIAATYVLTAHPDWRIRELIATDPGRSGSPGV